jgi:hypothetical protein
MKWLLPAAIVLVTGVVAIVPAWREQRLVVGRVAMVTCAEDVGDEAAGSPSQTLRFQLAEELPGQVPEYTVDQLVALGFDRADSALLHTDKPPAGRWPPVRPAWARLRPDSAHGGRLVVEELGPTRMSVWRDTASIVARVRVGWMYHGVPGPAPAGTDSTEKPGPRPSAVVFRFGILELMPAALHITAEQDRTIRQVNAGKECRGSRMRVVIANGPVGGLWVEGIVSQ